MNLATSPRSHGCCIFIRNKKSYLAVFSPLREKLCGDNLWHTCMEVTLNNYPLRNGKIN